MRRLTRTIVLAAAYVAGYVGTFALIGFILGLAIYAAIH